MNEYYNLNEFKESNKIFDDFLLNCKYKIIKKLPQEKFKVSTMTITSNFCENVNIKMIYERLKLNENIVYIENGKNNLRGTKKIKTKKSYCKKKIIKKMDKRKLGKGKPFSNQISIGIKCHNENHKHNNPICLKIFKNGNIQMTGCKNNEEIKKMYNIMFNNIQKINTEYLYKNKIINIYPICNIKSFNAINIKVEMINGTFKCNFKINLNKLFELIQRKFTDDEIFINCEKKTTLICYLKKYKTLNKIKNKEKCPSVFIYNTGAINIIAINKDILMKTYSLISNFIDQNYDEIVQKEINFDQNFIQN